MGIIKKQSLFSTVVIYSGFFIAIINNVLLVPKALSLNQLGFTTVLLSLSTIFYSYSSFGLVNIINKFSAYYRKHLPVKQNDLLSMSLLVTIAGSLLLTGIYLVFQVEIFSLFDQQELLEKYKAYIPLAGGFLLLQTVLITYTNTYYKTIWTNFVKEVFFRLYNTALIVLVIFKVIDFDLYIKLYMSAYILTSVLLSLYLIGSKRIALVTRPSRLTRRLWPFAWRMGLVTWSGEIMFSIGLQIDVLVIQSVLTSDKTGYYSFLVGFAALIMAPQRALVNISFPVLAELWRKKDMPGIRKLYQKSANTMFLVGGLVFLLVTTNTDSIFDIANKPQYYAEFFLSPNIIVLIGIARLIELGTGVNASIIYTAPKATFWITDFVASLLIIVVIIVSNFFMASTFGLIGIAYAGIFAYTLHNFFRIGYIYYKIRIQPFSVNMIKTVALIVGTYFIFDLTHVFFEDTFRLKVTSSPLLQVMPVVAIKSVIITVVYLFIAYSLKISEDVNLLTDQVMNRFRSVLGMGGSR